MIREVGTQITYLTSLADQGTLSLLPYRTTEEQYLITDILASGAFKLVYTDDFNTITASVPLLELKNIQLHCANTMAYGSLFYWQIQNVSGSTINVSATGVISKNIIEGVDVAQKLTVGVAQNNYVEIRPQQPNTEWTIHNIIAQDAIELFYTDGTNLISYRKYPSQEQALLNVDLRCSYDKWWKIKQLASGNKKIGYDGIITKGIQWL
jgi:hypothetical protein